MRAQITIFVNEIFMTALASTSITGIYSPIQVSGLSSVRSRSAHGSGPRSCHQFFITDDEFSIELVRAGGVPYCTIFYVVNIMIKILNPICGQKSKSFPKLSVFFFKINFTFDSHSVYGPRKYFYKILRLCNWR